MLPLAEIAEAIPMPTEALAKVDALTEEMNPEVGIPPPPAVPP